MTTSAKIINTRFIHERLTGAFKNLDWQRVAYEELKDALPVPEELRQALDEILNNPVLTKAEAVLDWIHEHYPLDLPDEAYQKIMEEIEELIVAEPTPAVCDP